MDEISIGGVTVGDGHDVFVIAEVGINHNGDMDTARSLIDRAAWAGASAVKLQTYITEKRVSKDSPIFGILKQCELSFDQQRDLIAYAKERGIIVFSTPFDEESVAFLAEVAVPCYKVASFDIVNMRLLKAIVRQKRPTIVSRGMANQAEIDAAVALLREADVPFALLHCISAYPVPSLSDLHLRTIAALKERYGCPVGFSDHTIGIEAPPYAVASGASIIEKHFTLSRTLDGPDHAMSTEPEEFQRMVTMIRQAREMLGQPVTGPIEAEKGTLQYRRIS